MYVPPSNSNTGKVYYVAVNISGRKKEVTKFHTENGITVIFQYFGQA